MVIEPDLPQSGGKNYERNTLESEGANEMPLKGSLESDRH